MVSPLSRASKVAAAARETAEEAPTAAKEVESPPSPAFARRMMDNVFGQTSTGEVGWAMREGAPVNDVTAGFEGLYAKSVRGESILPREAKKHVYLVVPGLFGNRVPFYLRPNLRALKKLGLDARRVAVGTESPVRSNAEIVRDSILNASKGGKKVVLLGHSKGGLDITAALSLYPELRRHVRAVITLQSPFGGSPIAQDLVRNPITRPVARALMRNVLRGDDGAYRDLTYDGRRAFLAEHPYDPQKIPTVSVGTSSLDPRSGTILPNAYMLARYGAANDGLVAMEDAFIPGANAVKVSGADHMAPAFPDPISVMKLKSAPLTEALVTLALQ